MNYEELLEKARELYESEDTPHVFKAWLLANIIGPADESEDERIKEGLIEYFRSQEILYDKVIGSITTKEVLAWLEKQGNFKMIDSNKVTKWLNDQACLGWIEDVEVDKFINKFKRDFNL